MSILTGKCDLYDTLSMCKLRTPEGSDKKEDLDKARYLVSDIMECFNIFKKKTNGVIYQHKKVNVTLNNQDYVASNCNMFEIIKHTELVDNKKQSGPKEKITYTYKYWFNEYTLKELNKKGVYIEYPIYFNTLLELLPYFPYIVTYSASDTDTMHIVISNESYIEELRNSAIQWGTSNNENSYYSARKRYADLYRDIVLEYFNPAGREQVEKVTFSKNDDKYIGKVSFPIDDNFDLDYHFDGESKPHWTSPKIYDRDKGLVEMSKDDYEYYLGDTVDIHYIKKI